MDVSSFGDAAYDVAAGNILPEEVDQLRTRAAVAEQTGGSVELSPADAMRLWAYENPELVREVYETGYDADNDGNVDFTGGRAVWERYVKDAPQWMRGVIDLYTDPLNAAFGAGTVLRSGGMLLAREANPLVRAFGRTLDIGGRTLQLPDELPGMIRRGAGGTRVGGMPAQNIVSDIISQEAMPNVGRDLDNLSPESIRESLTRLPRIGRWFERTWQANLRNTLQPVEESVQGVVRDIGANGPDPRDPLGGPDVPRAPVDGPDDNWTLPESIEQAIDNRERLPVMRLFDRYFSALTRRFPERTVSEAVSEVMSGVPVRRGADGVLADLTNDVSINMSPLQHEVHENVQDIQRRAVEAQRAAPTITPDVPDIPNSLRNLIDQADNELRGLGLGACSVADDITNLVREAELGTAVNDPVTIRPEDQLAGDTPLARARDARNTAERDLRALQTVETPQTRLDDVLLQVNGEQPRPAPQIVNQRGVPVQMGIGRVPEPQRPLEGTSLGRPIDPERPWDFLSPEGSPRRIVDQAEQRGRTDPAGWERFQQAYQPEAERFLQQQADLRDRSFPSGYHRYREEAMQEAEHVVNGVIPAWRAAYGDDTFNYNFRIQRNDAAPIERQRDNYLIEQATFGEGDDQIAAWNELKARAARDVRRRVPDTDLRDNILPRIAELRARLTGQQALDVPPHAAVPVETPVDTPVETPATTATGARETTLPMDRVRSTATMSEEELAAIGGRRLQPRNQPFNEQTATDIARDFNPDDYDRILVKQGDDGKYYIVSGHSRYEGLRRRGAENIDVKVTNVDWDEAVRIAQRGNEGRAGYEVFETANNVRRYRDADGVGFEAIGNRLRLGNAEKGTTGSSQARKYYEASFIEPGTRAYELVGEGVVDLDNAAAIGRGIQRGNLTIEDANDIAVRITNGGLNQREARDVIQRVIASRSRGETPPIDQMAGEVSAVRREQERLRDLRSQRNRLFNERAPFRLTERRLGQSDELSAQIRETEDEIRRVSAEMGIPVGRALIRNAKPEVDSGRVPTDALAPPTDIAGGGDVRLPGDLGSAALFHTGGFWQRNQDGTLSGPSVRPRNIAATFEQETAATARHVNLFGQGLASSDMANLRHRLRDTNETLYERGNRYFEQVRQEQPELTQAQAAVQAGDRLLQDYALQVLRDIQPKRALVYQEEYARLMQKNDADAMEAQVRAMEKAMGRDTPNNWYDTYLSMQRELKLYNPITGLRYVATQGVGNTVTSLLVLGMEVGGDVVRRAFNPRQLHGLFREIHHGPSPEDWWKPITPDEVTDAFAREEASALGITKTSSDAYHEEIGWTDFRSVKRTTGSDTLGITSPGDRPRGATTNISDFFANTLPDFANWMRLGRTRIPKDLSREERAALRGERSASANRWTRVLASPFIRDFTSTFDVTMRVSYFDHLTQMAFARVRNDVRDAMRASLPAGADAARFDEIWESLPTYFGANTIRREFREFGNGYAERQARDWQNFTNRTRDAAREEVNRVFFSGDETNLDAAIRRIFMFHYWMSRATPLYTEALLKRPGLLNAFLRGLEELREDAESGEFGDAVKGMYNVLPTIGAYNLFIRPFAFFQTAWQLGNDSTFTNEDQSGLWTFFQTVGLMPSPLIDTAANMFGMQGQNSFAPDLFSACDSTSPSPMSRPIASRVTWDWTCRSRPRLAPTTSLPRCGHGQAASPRVSFRAPCKWISSRRFRTPRWRSTISSSTSHRAKSSGWTGTILWIGR
jgi:hypothetical protein